MLQSILTTSAVEMIKFTLFNDTVSDEEVIDLEGNVRSPF